ncbi:hypothetical protein OG226_16170 [Streptomyces sp. NBC_01261]|uniref:hypothetical protein n=1 Tax=unclassified Streptomyces TaxID=2593676 RepID=UPI002E2C88C8|nr:MULTISPECIES: hypothetical protein [unclassified Streptomyces]
MGDGIQWMVGATTSSGWMLDVHFARGIGVEELARRMGAPLGTTAEPMTDAGVADLDIGAYPHRGPGNAVIRVGGEWSHRRAHRLTERVEWSPHA